MKWVCIESDFDYVAKNEQKKKIECFKFRARIIRLYKYDTRSNFSKYHFPISGNNLLNIFHFISWYSYPGIKNRNLNRISKENKFITDIYFS